jgi:hypothetical protein
MLVVAVLECGKGLPLWYFPFSENKSTKAAMARRTPKGV